MSLLFAELHEPTAMFNKTRILIVVLLALCDVTFADAESLSKTVRLGEQPDLANKDTVIFVGKVMSFTPPPDYGPNNVGQCNFQVVSECRGRFVGKEITVHGPFFREANGTLSLEPGRKFSKRELEIQRKLGSLQLVACRPNREGNRFDVCEFNVLPIGVICPSQVQRSDLADVEKALATWAHLEDNLLSDKSNADAVNLLKSKDDFNWMLGASFVAVRGTVKQRQQLSQEFSYGANWSHRRVWWFIHLIKTAYPVQERPSDSAMFNAFRSYIENNVEREEANAKNHENELLERSGKAAH